MKQKPNLPTKCPSCESPLGVKRLACSACGTEVEGQYDMPALLQLSKEDQDFILKFVLSSGSLKQMAKWMERSYPLVRNRLDEIIEKLNALNNVE
tara:strand:- start:180 stop:464 length:285 start_codon:yes stop_codon:yes gene_type:complete